MTDIEKAEFELFKVKRAHKRNVLDLVYDTLMGNSHHDQFDETKAHLPLCECVDNKIEFDYLGVSYTLELKQERREMFDREPKHERKI